MAFESSPMDFVKDWRSPVLLIQGDDDRNVQFNQTVMLAEALRRKKVEVEELILPDEIHDFLLYRSWREAYRATVAFFKKRCYSQVRLSLSGCRWVHQQLLFDLP